MSGTTLIASTDQSTKESPRRSFDELSDELIVLAALRARGGRFNPIFAPEIARQCERWTGDRFGETHSKRRENVVEIIDSFILGDADYAQIMFFGNEHGVMLRPNTVALTNALAPWFENLIPEAEERIHEGILKAAMDCNSDGESIESRFSAEGLASPDNIPQIRFFRTFNSSLTSEDAGYWSLREEGLEYAGVEG